MKPDRPNNIINVADAPEQNIGPEGRFHARRKKLGLAAGGVQLGASHVRVPPRSTAWPYHFHAANEEAIYILEGRGRLRLDDESHPVGPGDWIALPAGPIPHRLDNEGDTDLVYLCVSTMHATDVCVYPDSGKVGVFGGSAPGGSSGDRYVVGYYRRSDEVPYYDGEV